MLKKGGDNDPEPQGPSLVPDCLRSLPSTSAQAAPTGLLEVAVISALESSNATMDSFYSLLEVGQRAVS